MDWCNASTRDVCPVPDASNCCPLAKIIVLDFVCLQILEAKIKSSISEGEGSFFVTVLRSSL